MKLVLAPEETSEQRWILRAVVAVIALVAYNCGFQISKSRTYNELKRKNPHEMVQHVQNWNK